MGLLIDIEGIDGSGKGTQAARLCAAAEQAGYSAKLISFPRYSATRFGRGIADFLNGRFGSLDAVSPFLASLLYAGDRYESRELLTSAIESHDVVVLDRYVASNLAHQASKRTGAERAELIAWIEGIEYGVYGLPRPDLVILLELPVAAAQRLIARKAARDYTNLSADLQEADSLHLGQARELYLELAARDLAWQILPCEVDNRLRTVEEVAADIWTMVAARLP